VEQLIHIGNDIEIRILEIRGDTVSIGIEAPKSVEILRSELIHSVSESNREATTVDAKIFSQTKKKSE